jgi:hypothetical protein
MHLTPPRTTYCVNSFVNYCPGFASATFSYIAGQRHGVTEDDGGIRITLTQTDLANLIEASREAVAVQLKEMRVLGLLKTSYRSIRSTDLEGLKKIARFSIESTTI